MKSCGLHGRTDSGGQLTEAARRLAAMNDRETTQRVVGFLTQALEVRRLLIENPDRDDLHAESAIISDLVAEATQTSVAIPGDASPEEVVALVMRELGPVVHRLLAVFALAFTDLAEVHDSGNPDISSEEVLRRLALNAEEL